MLERTSLPRPSERLSIRRRRRRRRTRTSIVVLTFAFIGLIIYCLWRPGVRISHITIVGTDSSLAVLASTTMQGTYFDIVPRDSLFFISKHAIRTAILTARPEIAAVSITRSGWNALTITADRRTPIAHWCGNPLASTSAQNTVPAEVSSTKTDNCYLFDANGFIYATATQSFFSTTASSTLDATSSDKTLTPFILFDVLVGMNTSAITKTLADANAIPAIFNFARKLSSFGAQIGAIVIRGNEVDLFIAPVDPTGAIASTRITYLVGDEQNAYTALNSARADFNLTDGSLEYLDLRFLGKIYLKKRVNG